LCHEKQQEGSTAMNARWRKTMKWISTVTAGALLSITVLFDASVAFAAEKAGKAAQPPKVRRELVQMRTENSKTYLQPDGKTYVMEQYLSPIHYKENGVWHDIDNKVEAASGEKALDPELSYANKANRFRVGFAKQSKAGKLVRFKLGGAHADFRLVNGENVPAKVSGNTVTYAGVYPGTDLVYHVGSTGVKEEWVLHEYKGQSVFTMELNVKNAKAEKQKDGSITFKDGKGNREFTIPRPVMVDANDLISRDISLELRQEGAKTYLDLKADEKWLQDPKRKYPVILDPTLEIQGTNNTFDAFVSEANPTTNFGLEPFLITGTHTDYGKTRSFIKFDLQPLLSGAQITSARLYLNQYMTVANQQVDLYPVTSDWTSTTVTWNMQPTIGSLLSSTTVGDVGEYSWDLTSLAQGWYAGTTKNYGVSLRHQVETNDRKSFRSSDYAVDPTKKPKLVITYTISPLGEEDFWTTSATNVNTYNGNFYLPQTDVQIPGRGVPATVDRHYNSRSTFSGIFGYGWTSNIEQRLIDSGNGPIQYIDEDGTVHSFTPNGDGTYKTSAVLQLELVKNGDGTYDLTTADQTKYHFNTSGKLVQITDSNNNTTTITYTGSNPTTITDASGRQVTLTFDANNRVTKVTDPANRTVSTRTTLPAT
jgi:YD repeat-containing protein